MESSGAGHAAGFSHTRSGATGSKPLSVAAARAFPCSYPTIGTRAIASPTAAGKSRHADAVVATVVKTFEIPIVAPVRLMIAPVVTACSSRTARTCTVRSRRSSGRMIPSRSAATAHRSRSSSLVIGCQPSRGRVRGEAGPRNSHRASNKTVKPCGERSRSAKLSFTEHPGLVSIRLSTESAASCGASVTASGYRGGDPSGAIHNCSDRTVGTPCDRQTMSHQQTLFCTAATRRGSINAMLAASSAPAQAAVAWDE